MGSGSCPSLDSACARSEIRLAGRAGSTGSDMASSSSSRSRSGSMSGMSPKAQRRFAAWRGLNSEMWAARKAKNLVVKGALWGGEREGKKEKLYV